MVAQTQTVNSALDDIVFIKAALVQLLEISKQGDDNNVLKKKKLPTCKTRLNHLPCG